MNSWQSIDLIWLVGVLVLVLSALSVRRMSLGFLLRSLVSWAVIALLAFVAVAHRHELSALFARATAKLGLDDQQVEVVVHAVASQAGSDVRAWRSLARHRPRVGPMLPTGIPSASATCA